MSSSGKCVNLASSRWTTKSQAMSVPQPHQLCSSWCCGAQNHWGRMTSTAFELPEELTRVESTKEEQQLAREGALMREYWYTCVKCVAWAAECSEREALRLLKQPVKASRLAKVDPYSRAREHDMYAWQLMDIATTSTTTVSISASSCVSDGPAESAYDATSVTGSCPMHQRRRHVCCVDGQHTK